MYFSSWGCFLMTCENALFKMKEILHLHIGLNTGLPFIISEKLLFSGFEFKNQWKSLAL